MDIEHKPRSSVQSDSVDTAISLSSSASSYSVITLKDSPQENVFDGRLSTRAESVAVATDNTLDLLEKQQQPNCPVSLPSRLLPSSDCALFTVTTQPGVDTSYTEHWNTGLVVDVSVDRLEHRMMLRNKPKLQVTEHIAEVYHYAPSFPCLPVIMESCISDDALLSDISVASGEGYIADGGGLMRSESCQSNASSPNASLSNLVDKQPSSHDSDEAHLSMTSVSSYGERALYSEGEPSTTVARAGRKLSAKSFSDGIDSAVVCTPSYSSQTSQDSTSTMDKHSSCQLVGLVTDDRPSQPLSLAADEMHSDQWENIKVRQATVSMSVDENACEESLSKDSDDDDDELSTKSVKVEWDIDSDSEMTNKRLKASVIPIKSDATLIRQPLPAVSSISQEMDRPWCPEPVVTRRACCACASCVILRQSVFTTADVVPTISVRLCSSVVDVVCLVRRLVDVCGTWLQVLCDSAYHIEHSRHSHSDLHSKETALMRSTSDDHTTCHVGVVHADIAGSSVDLQHCGIMEGLENIQESLLQRLFDVSDVLQYHL